VRRQVSERQKTTRQKFKRECQEERRAKFSFAVFVAMRVCDVCMCASVQVCVSVRVHVSGHACLRLCREKGRERDICNLCRS